MKFLQKKRIELGKGHIIQYTFFEWKKLGGIWFYNWKTIDQNRFHTHAFNSIAITLNGSYVEEVFDNNIITKKTIKKRFIPRFLPRNYCHRILEAAPNTWTMVIFGKWSDTWKEYFENTKTWVTYGWGRKKINKVKNNEKTIQQRKS